MGVWVTVHTGRQCTHCHYRKHGVVGTRNGWEPSAYSQCAGGANRLPVRRNLGDPQPCRPAASQLLQQGFKTKQDNPRALTEESWVTWLSSGGGGCLVFGLICQNVKNE